jgi:hypothetical protein
LRVFQLAQPRRQGAAPDPHPAARQPHRCRAGPESAPAVERCPGYPQLGGHLLDREQRAARGSGVCGRGGGGPAGSGWRSRGRPVRGSATTDAPLRPPRQVRPRPGSRRQSPARGGRPGERGRGEWPCGRAARRGGCGRAARSCRRGRPAGPGAGSRAVTSCASSPLPGAVATGPVAGRRGALACRPGLQASSLHSARPVKSARRGAGLHEGRPPGGYREGGTGARTATVRAPVAHAPAPGRRPGTGSHGCARRVILAGGSVIGRSLMPSGFPSHYRNRVFGAFFRSAPRKRCW